MDEPEQDPLMHPPGTAEWEKQNREESGWSPPTLIFAITILVVFIVAGLWAAADHVQEEARRVGCGCHGQIALAIINYVDQHGAYPPARMADANGRPMHSWRALILPFLDPNLAKEYRLDEPWDGPNNSKLHSRMPSVFRCTSDRNAIEGTTNYVAVVGDETMWPPSAGRKLEEIADGRENTILIVETMGLNIPWLEPRDLDFSQMDFQINTASGPGITSKHRKGASVWMADWHWRFLPNDTSADVVRGLLTVNGGEQVSPP